jgi:acetylornithine deacetylase/succinyl-diaminopimelate desuccinylase-like protein
MGPGKSERSHAANEFIAVPEIAQAIDLYTTVLQAYFAP